MTTNAEGVLTAVRAETGTTYGWPGDWLALFALESITTGSFNERMLAWINVQLGTSYTNLPEAQQAFAVDQGFANWASMNTFSLVGSGAGDLLGSETQGLALDFTDDYYFATTSQYGSAKIIDTSTPANDYDSHPYGKLSYTSASAKMCLGPSGTLRFGAHNLLTYSEQFDNAAWSTTGLSVTANSVVAPDGTTTADTLTASGGATAAIFRNVGLVTGATYRVAIRAKAGTKSFIQFSASSGSWGTNTRANFDISTGVLGTVDSGLSASISSLGNGWYLCVVEDTYTGASVNDTIWCIVDDASAAREASATAGTVYVWGAQLTRTPCDTTYLSTTSSARYALPYEWNSSGVLQGILVEEARTNSLIRSEDFGTTWSTSATTVTTNAIASPDGQTTADLLLEAATTANHGIDTSGGVFAGSTTTGTYTFSVFAKAQNRSVVNLSVNTATATQWTAAAFDLSAGTVLSGTTANSPFSAAAAEIQSFGNGWYRCILTFTYTSGLAFYPFISIYDSTSFSRGDYGRLSYAGNASNGLYLWGAQLEAGSFATSYIPVPGSSTVTRAADDISLVTTAFPFSLANGTVYLEATRRASTGNRWLLGFATSAGLFDVVGGDTNLNFRHGATSNIDLTNAAQFTSGKIAGGYTDGGTHSLSVNGGAASSTASNSATIVGSSLLRIGVDGPGTSANYFNSHIAKIMYLPRRMSGSELQTLST